MFFRDATYIQRALSISAAYFSKGEGNIIDLKDMQVCIPPSLAHVETLVVTPAEAYAQSVTHDTCMHATCMQHNSPSSLASCITLQSNQKAIASGSACHYDCKGARSGLVGAELAVSGRPAQSLGVSSGDMNCCCKNGLSWNPIIL